MNSKSLSRKIVNLIFEKKGYEVKSIEIKKVSTLTDFFVVCSADSDTQVKAISDHVEDGLKKEGIRLWHKEGYRGLNWVLLDYVDVVVHVFHKEARSFYSLEKLWGDAPVVQHRDTAKSLVEETEN
ncbi:MAG: ribosome silencing factor [Ignavibacteriaceae bacterium]|nr:ribosome silencing factor [Ignavibacteriaceae bacterium]